MALAQDGGEKNYDVRENEKKRKQKLNLSLF